MFLKCLSKSATQPLTYIARALKIWKRYYSKTIVHYNVKCSQYMKDCNCVTKSIHSKPCHYRCKASNRNYSDRNISETNREPKRWTCARIEGVHAFIRAQVILNIRPIPTSKYANTRTMAIQRSLLYDMLIWMTNNHRLPVVYLVH